MRRGSGEGLIIPVRRGVHSLRARAIASASWDGPPAIQPDLRACEGILVASNGGMEKPLQITFRGIPSSEAVESYVRTRADKLERLSERIVGCHVTLESPHRHKQHGRHWVVRIDLAVPGLEIAVTRDPSESKEHEDLYAAIDAAFDDAKRMLDEHTRTARGDVKPRETPTRHARVAKLHSFEGYGFLATSDGDEIYFHENSVLNHGFGRLAIGTLVRFVEEAGEKGPQASTVAIVR